MTCKEFRELMYLRNDELDADEARAMEEHRTGCAACAAEFARTASFHGMLHDAKAPEPILDTPQRFIDVVLNRIEEEATASQRERTEPAVDRPIHWLFTPAFRAAAAAVLLFITGAFAVEYTSGYVVLKGFEERIETTSSMQRMNTMRAGANDVAMLHAASDLARLFAGKGSHVEFTDNWVMMNKRSFEQFILLYNELKKDPSRLPPEIRTTNPELVKLLETKDQHAQIDSLLKEREVLIRELNTLLPKEGRLP